MLGFSWCPANTFKQVSKLRAYFDLDSQNLPPLCSTLQAQRDAFIALETTVTELTRQNEKVESERAIQVRSNTVLQAELEGQKAEAAAVKQQFTAYKQQHTLGGELGALQDAVAGLQAQLLTDRSDKKKE